MKYFCIRTIFNSDSEILIVLSSCLSYIGNMLSSVSIIGKVGDFASFFRQGKPSAVIEEKQIAIVYKNIILKPRIYDSNIKFIFIIHPLQMQGVLCWSLTCIIFL